LAEISFAGNHAFNNTELRTEFPVKKNDLMNRSKIASGLDNVRKLYSTNGFIDVVFIPNTTFSSAIVILTVDVIEGPQYHMGKLEIFAKKELADKLRAEWQLAEGAVFDRTYLDEYIDSDRSLLPPGFQRSHVQIVRDCPNAMVEVRLPLDAMDPSSQSMPKDNECGSPDNSSK
jgi:Surface antigen variable number repeat